jgi:hypothetical protein
MQHDSASEDRILWTGENRVATAKFIGRGENATIHASNIDLPTGTPRSYVRARPGDTIVRTGPNTFDVERP